MGLIKFFITRNIKAADLIQSNNWSFASISKLSYVIRNKGFPLSEFIFLLFRSNIYFTVFEETASVLEHFMELKNHYIKHFFLSSTLRTFLESLLLEEVDKKCRVWLNVGNSVKILQMMIPKVSFNTYYSLIQCQSFNRGWGDIIQCVWKQLFLPSIRGTKLQIYGPNTYQFSWEVIFCWHLWTYGLI